MRQFLHEKNWRKNVQASKHALRSDSTPTISSCFKWTVKALRVKTKTAVTIELALGGNALRFPQTQKESVDSSADRQRNRGHRKVANRSVRKPNVLRVSCFRIRKEMKGDPKTSTGRLQMTLKLLRGRGIYA